MMKIEINKTYRVIKYRSNGEMSDCGNLPGSDVRSILKGYEYDSDLEMWFTPRATIGYEVIEQ